jgi:IS30 family transposase
MVSISERPAEVDDRAVPGHWEGDLILGSVASASAIGTLVERQTRFVMLLHLPDDHGAVAIQEAIVAKMAELPAQLRRSLTWDQGIEMANHAAIAAATELDIYFCDPHSPWQRGTNENTNGLLRQYFPKGTDIRIYSSHYLDYVAAELNGAHVKPWTGKHLPKRSTNYCPNHPLLHRPLETAQRAADETAHSAFCSAAFRVLAELRPSPRGRHTTLRR